MNTFNVIRYANAYSISKQDYSETQGQKKPILRMSCCHIVNYSPPQIASGARSVASFCYNFFRLHGEMLIYFTVYEKQTRSVYQVQPIFRFLQSHKIVN